MGDVAKNEWIAAMMGIYKSIKGKEPGSSVDPHVGTVGGPFMRFLAAAGEPLGMALPAKGTRSRLRNIKERSSKN